MSALPDESCGCRPPLRLCSYHEGYRDALHAAETDVDNPFDGVCKCDRALVCVGCQKDHPDCTCDPVFADLDEGIGPDGADTADLDPLTRTLLGLPSGIHCHDETGRCLSGHCAGGDL